ncbi:ribosome biosynthesis protein nip7 [Entophlyctis sp. JEL0112]|nr:ribosome biosynthesis protein nip7 [Entophlyctis sp. JEL0112]
MASVSTEEAKMIVWMSIESADGTFEAAVHYDVHKPTDPAPCTARVYGVPRRLPLAKDSHWVIDRKPVEQAAMTEGIGEVLLSDDIGNIYEGLTSNFFCIVQPTEDKCVVRTAPLHTVLNGTMLSAVERVCKSMGISFDLKMRPLTEPEVKTLFEKLAKYIGRNITHLIDRTDDPHCFRVHRDRVYYVSEAIMRKATSVNPHLMSLGVCFGKFSKTGIFRLHVTALDVLAQYAKYKVWVKPNGEMPFMYGNHVLKAHLGRITEDTPEHQGVVVFSMSDVPLGFGATARSTQDAKKLDPTSVIVFHQADVGEYLRNEDTFFLVQYLAQAETSDRTITTKDTGTVIIDASIGEAERKRLDNAVLNGTMTYRQAISEMWAGVTFNAFDDAVALCADHKNVTLKVVSAGLKQIVELYLKGFENVEIFSNECVITHSEDGRAHWSLNYVDDSPHGHDKGSHIRKLRETYRANGLAENERPKIIFIGDGVSDLSAARDADVVFAKRGNDLATYCEREGVSVILWDDFNQICDWIESFRRSDAN